MRDDARADLLRFGAATQIDELGRQVSARCRRAPARCRAWRRNRSTKPGPPSGVCMWPASRLMYSRRTDPASDTAAGARRNRASTTLKIAVVPPMPRASVATAAAVKAGCLRSMRERKAHVLPHALDHRFPADVPNAILHGFNAADLHACGANGGVAAHAAGHLSVRRPSPGTRRSSSSRSCSDAVLLEQATKPADDPAEDGHHSSPSEALRILEIAAVWTSQSRASFLNLARPCAVSR